MKKQEKQIWFTADTHFGHTNILKYAKRPFKSISEMDEQLIRNWNDVIQPTDDVYHLGDFSLTDSKRTLEILNRLNGQKFLIKGNHEKSVMNDNQCKGRFAWIKDYYELVIEDQDANRGRQVICLFHYPIASWDKGHHGSWNLHGHCHGSFPESEDFKRIDVGVDCFRYAPVSYDELKKIMSTRKFVAVDHHTGS